MYVSDSLFPRRWRCTQNHFIMEKTKQLLYGCLSIFDLRQACESCTDDKLRLYFVLLPIQALLRRDVALFKSTYLLCQKVGRLIAAAIMRACIAFLLLGFACHAHGARKLKWGWSSASSLGQLSTTTGANTNSGLLSTCEHPHLSQVVYNKKKPLSFPEVAASETHCLH